MHHGETSPRSAISPRPGARAVALLLSASLSLGGCQSGGLGAAQTGNAGGGTAGNTSATQTSPWNACIVGAVIGAVGFTVYNQYINRKGGSAKFSAADQRKILAAVVLAGCAIPAAATAIGNAFKNDADRVRHEDAFARAAKRASQSSDNDRERERIIEQYEKRPPARNPTEKRKRDEELKRQLDKLGSPTVEETWTSDTGTGGVEIGGPVKDPTISGQDCRYMKEYVRNPEGQQVQNKVYACRKGPGEQYVRVDPNIMQG